MSCLLKISKSFIEHVKFKFLSQPFHVAEVFTGISGQYVSIADTIKGFKMILEGECDSIAENDLYMKGSIDQALEGAKE